MDIVLTDWRGVFTSEHPTLKDIPHKEDSYYGNLAVMALHHAPYQELRGLPSLDKKWREVTVLEGSRHIPYCATLVEHPTQARNILLVTGDTRAILHHCSSAISKRGEKFEISSLERYILQQRISQEESRGIFPIGIAIKHMHRSNLDRDDIAELTFLGIVSSAFEYIPQTYHVVRGLRSKHIDIKIVSSMPIQLSRSIARHVGLPSSEDTSLAGELIASMSDTELQECVSHVSIFSELQFLEERRIMRLLEDMGHRIVQYEFERS